MEWEKKGLIYVPDGSLDWSKTHAQIPTPVLYDETTLRIFFATRNTQGKTQTGFVDVDVDNPQKVLNVGKNPVIALGTPGLHDDDGAMPFCVVKSEEEYKFYYTGWHIPQNVSYDLTIGLVTSHNLNVFQKFSKGPLISKSIFEPYWAAAPCVIKDGSIFKMWYISCYDWVKVENKLEPVYNIKYAESLDGVSWKLSDRVVIEPKFENEALGRPWVIKGEDKYYMWYSTRGSNDYRSKEGEHYTIGYAESINGIDWSRKDNECGISISKDGWDSEMVEYASIYKDEKRCYLFYNGNGFGRSGFGYAIFKEKEN